MKIKRIPVGVYGANCYIVIDENSKKALLIDPGDEGKLIKEEIDKLNIDIKDIFITHGHLDHTGAVKELRDELNAKVYMSFEDEKMILNNSQMFGNIKNCGKADIIIKDEDNFNVGGLKIKCICTPGHTPGGMSFLINNILFTGDTLFQSSIGRTDFKGGDFDTIIKSIKNKLIILPDDTMVLPGHGPETSIKYEKVNNPFL